MGTVDRAPGGGGGTLIFYIYIGLGDFFGGQNFEIQYFFGFSEKSLFFGVVSFLRIFFWVCSLIDYFLGSFLISMYFFSFFFLGGGGYHF